MENIVYQISDTTSAVAETVHKLEYYCCQTNEVNPHREIRELGIVVTNNHGLQIDFSLDERELKSLISYLSQMLEYNEEFNSDSKPDVTLPP